VYLPSHVVRLPQSLIEFVDVGNEPDMRAAVALVNEVAESGAFLEPLGYVSDNDEAQSVGQKLLDYLTCNACSETEEVVIKAMSRDHDYVGLVLRRCGDHVHRIPVSSEWSSIGHQLHYADTLEIIMSSNHSSIMPENQLTERPRSRRG
jgi:hypothetical protein